MVNRNQSVGGISRSRVLLFIVLVIVGLLLLMFFSNSSKANQYSEQSSNNQQYHLANDQNGDGIINKIEQILSIKPNSNKNSSSADSSLVTNTTIADGAQSKTIAVGDVPPIIGNSNTYASSANDLAISHHNFMDIDKKYQKQKLEQQFTGLDSKMVVYSSTYPDTKLFASDTASNTTRKGYKLNAGSVIPATMINGINSDLVGQIIAQVRQNVYDSISGKYILIPQGAKLIGLYDSNIAYGQQRLIVIWNRLIYPNGKSVKLQAMPGTDLAGYQGFHDIVDNKYARIFGMSFVMGVISGAMQYSQNNIANTNNLASPTVGQTMASSLGQQLGSTGLAITNKNLNVSPTLIIRPNYPFNIMLTSDLDLVPYA